MSAAFMAANVELDSGQRKLVLALKLRDEIVEAALWRNHVRLATLLPALYRAKFSAEVLSHSGLPFLLQDSTVWPSHLAGEVQCLLRRWREQHQEVRTEHPDLASLSANARRKLEQERPFRGRLCSAVVIAVDKLEEELQQVDGTQSALRLHRALSARLVTRGFERLAMLDGLTDAETSELGSTSWERALLARAKLEVANKAQVARLKQLRAAEGPPAPQPQSAKTLAMRVQSVDLAQVSTDIEATLNTPKPMGEMRPTEAVKHLAAQAKQGVEVTEALDEAVAALAIQQIWHSRASVASGLKAWGGFAEQVLSYEADSTLPPRSTLDAQRFVTVL